MLIYLVLIAFKFKIIGVNSIALFLKSKQKKTLFCEHCEIIYLCMNTGAYFFLYYTFTDPILLSESESKNIYNM